MGCDELGRAVTSAATTTFFTSAATFLVAPGLAPLLLKIRSAASILTTFSAALIASFIS